MAIKSPFSGLVPLAALPSVVFLGYACWRLWDFTLDDAYISLQYARNLAEGRGLVFNPGERVEGFSNPLWVFLLSAFGAAGAPWVATMKTMGFSCALLTLLVLASTTKHLADRAVAPNQLEPVKTKSRSRASKKKYAGNSVEDRAENSAISWLIVLLPTLLAVSHPGMAYYAVAGLETPLFGLLLLLATALLFRDEAKGAYTPWPYVPLFATALTRPEGIVFLPLFFVRRIWVAYRSPHLAERPAAPKMRVAKEAMLAGLATLPFVCYLIWKSVV